jgi:hypothetical protein
MDFTRIDLFSRIGIKTANGYKRIKGYLNAGIAVRKIKRSTVRLIKTSSQSLLSNNLILDIPTIEKSCTNQDVDYYFKRTPIL